MNIDTATFAFFGILAALWLVLYIVRKLREAKRIAERLMGADNGEHTR